MSKLGPEFRKRVADQAADELQSQAQEVWYHEGPPELKETRQWIAGYSLRRSRDRLKKARLRLSRPEDDAEETAGKQKMHTRLRNFGNYSSQIGDQRPLTWCSFSPKGDFLATSSLSGLCKLWSIPNCEHVKTLKGHNTRAGTIIWHPQAGSAQSASDLNLVSSDAEGHVRFWSMESEEPIASLECLGKRVSRMGFHPTGKYLGTTCHDHSWRLWDVETKKELLHQEGHSRPAFDIAFHADGSLVGTGGMDSVGRIWDLRSGKCILTLEGHIKAIYGMDFSPNGYQVATGSEDHQVRLWDLRQRRTMYTIPAHKGLVSRVKYHNDGQVLVTSSFDNSAKIWAMPEILQLAHLQGHDGRVMAADISPNMEYVVTASADRTFKLWAAD